MMLHNEKVDMQELADSYQVPLEYLEGGEVLDLEGVTVNVLDTERCDYRNANN